MKAPWIKRVLSYFTEIHVESVTSEYNESLQVLLKNGRYQLCTPNAIYSYADKYTNFREAFEQIDLSVRPIDHVLVLGFGLGSIPYMLEKIFVKNYTYTGVEIDESVIYLASKYTLDDLDSDIELIHADAYAFVLQSSVRYDLICIDIFIDDQIPDVFLTQTFLQDVAENLSDAGFILFNHLAHTEADNLAASKYYHDTFNKIFPKSAVLQVSKNHVLISDNSRVVVNK